MINLDFFFYMPVCETCFSTNYLDASALTIGKTPLGFKATDCPADAAFGSKIC